MPYFQEVIEIIQKIDNPRMNAFTYRIHGFLAELEGDEVVEILAPAPGDALLFDRPDGRLKKQREPVPYLGGLALYLSFLISTVFLTVLPSSEIVVITSPPSSPPISIVPGSLVVRISMMSSVS